MIARLNATGGWYLSTNGGGMLGGPPVDTSAVRQLLELALTEPHGDRALCVTCEGYQVADRSGRHGQT